MVQTRFALILFYSIVAYKTACLDTFLSKAMEISKNTVQILLMFEVLFTQYSKMEALLCGAKFNSEPNLFFGNYLSGVGLKSVQDDFQCSFARMTDEAHNNSYKGCLLLELS